MKINNLELSVLDIDIPTVEDPERDSVVEINNDEDNTSTTSDLVSNKEVKENEVNKDLEEG